MDRHIALPLPLVAALHRYLDARNAALIAARRALGVNELDARALLYIASHSGTRPGNLRDYLGITSAGVTTLRDRLELRSTVRREIDADDRRVIRLTATVDLGSEPWSALTRFDDAFTSALEGTDLDDSARLAGALDSYTASAALASQ